ncbi:MAG TPA: serine hydrolase [Terriglobales bacterium]|nr:serine hydrolase [Terriglobales bacterium]
MTTQQQHKIASSEGLIYGYGWWIVPTQGLHSGQEICHGGNINGFSARLSRFPDEDVVLVVLSNLQDTDSRQVVRDLYSILHRDPYEAPRLTYK